MRARASESEMKEYHKRWEAIKNDKTPFNEMTQAQKLNTYGDTAMLGPRAPWNQRPELWDKNFNWTEFAKKRFPQFGNVDPNQEVVAVRLR